MYSDSDTISIRVHSFNVFKHSYKLKDSAVDYSANFLVIFLKLVTSNDSEPKALKFEFYRLLFSNNINPVNWKLFEELFFVIL